MQDEADGYTISIYFTAEEIEILRRIADFNEVSPRQWLHDLAVEHMHRPLVKVTGDLKL